MKRSMAFANYFRGCRTYFFRGMAGLVLLAILSGCASTKLGVGPDQSTTIDEDIQGLQKQFEFSTSITQYYASPTREARDKLVTGRLVLIDLQYLKFISALSANKQNLDAATDLMTLSLSVAGTIVPGAHAKEYLAAAAALVTGSKAVVDKDFYFQKSIDALVAAMNAKRKQVLVAILDGLRYDLDRYSITNAVVDVNEYYYAGTLTGALQFIQLTATESSQATDVVIAKIRIAKPLSDSDIKIKQSLTDAIGAGGFSLDQAKAALKELGTKEADLPSDMPSALRQLQQDIRTMDVTTVHDAFKKAGIVKT